MRKQNPAQEDPANIDVPPAWDRIPLEEWEGVLMIVGAPDTGKTTFARTLTRRLCAIHERVGFIDGDVGQARLGPPTTMTLAVRQPGEEPFPPSGPRIHYFVGSTSPRGHMLPMIIGAHKLARCAQERGAAVTVLDTTGLIDRSQGGGALKHAMIDLLEPTALLALQRKGELEHLLAPLRRSLRTQVLELPCSSAVRRRDVEARRAHRQEAFRRYFADAEPMEVPWTQLAVIPAPDLEERRLVALEDERGLTLALGIVLDRNRREQTVQLHTPARSLGETDTLRLGDLWLDPETCREV